MSTPTYRPDDPLDKLGERLHPRKVAAALKDAWKFFWGVDFWIKLIVVIASFVIAATMGESAPPIVGVLIFLAGLFGTAVIKLGDSWRDLSEGLKREAEFFEAYGREFDEHLAAKAESTLTGHLVGFLWRLDKTKIGRWLPHFLKSDLKFVDNEFERVWYRSNLAPGDEKALEMLAESSYFSASHAEWLFKTYNCLMYFLCTLVSLGAVFAATTTIQTSSVIVVKWGIIILGALYALNILKLRNNYQSFMTTSNQIYKDAKEMLDEDHHWIGNDIDLLARRLDVLRLWEEYQISRSTSPPLFKFVHKLQRDDITKRFNKVIYPSFGSQKRKAKTESEISPGTTQQLNAEALTAHAMVIEGQDLDNEQPVQG